MTSLLQRLIPVVSLMSGVLLATVLVSLRERPTSSEVRARAEFAELDGRQQDEIKSRARQLLRSESELQRLRDIHVAVVADPKLKAKLDSVDQWLSKVDSATRNELSPSGEFSPNWMNLVEQKFHQKPKQEAEIRILLDSRDGSLAFNVTEDQFHAFVDDIVLEYGTLQEQSDLNGYKTDAAATLAKCVWISEGVLGGDQLNLDQMFRAIDFAHASIMDSLADEEDLAMISRWEQMVGRSSSRVALVWKALYWGMTHCAHQLRDEYPSPTDEELVNSFDQLTRDEQLAMISNPASARQDLDLVAIREYGDESIKQLLKEYEILSAKLLDRSRDRSFTRGRGSRPGGGRKGFSGRPR